MPRLSKKQKRKLKHQAIKSLTIVLYVISVVITGRSTYLISPLPFDEFQVWRETQMEYVFAAILALFLANVILPGWAINKHKYKTAAILCCICCLIPLIWLITLFSLNFS